jgi:hypothetical protein
MEPAHKTLSSTSAVIPAKAGIQTVTRGDSWIPGQARNDGVGFVIPANAEIQSAAALDPGTGS